MSYYIHLNYLKVVTSNNFLNIFLSCMDHANIEMGQLMFESQNRMHDYASKSIVSMEEDRISNSLSDFRSKSLLKDQQCL